MREEIYHAMAEAERTHWWFAGRRRIVEHVLRGAGLPTDARVLEIGCGTGGNLELLSGFGRVSAVELDDVARGYARERSGLDVVKGHLPDGIPFEAGSFDLIVLLDVLEHVEDDRGSLVAIERLLAPNGALLVTVPALRFLWSEHDESHHHRRRYTRGELRTATERAGLRIETLTYYNSWLFPVVAAARWLSRVTGRAPTSDLEVPRPVVNRTLTAVFGSERHVITHAAFPVGVSLLMLARRDA